MDVWVDGMAELGRQIEWMDKHLDADVAEAYKDMPLAQDWARCAKISEEAGEVIDALIGITGQNPRKGVYGSEEDLFKELCDVALTALYGLQHFTKDVEGTLALLVDRAMAHRQRVDGGREGVNREGA